MHRSSWESVPWEKAWQEHGVAHTPGKNSRGADLRCPSSCGCCFMLFSWQGEKDHLTLYPFIQVGGRGCGGQSPPSLSIYLTGFQSLTGGRPSRPPGNPSAPPALAWSPSLGAVCAAPLPATSQTGACAERAGTPPCFSLSPGSCGSSASLHLWPGIHLHGPELTLLSFAFQLVLHRSCPCGQSAPRCRGHRGPRAGRRWQVAVRWDLGSY